jgi:hypothetical protein
MKGKGMEGKGMEGKRMEGKRMEAERFQNISPRRHFRYDHRKKNTAYPYPAYPKVRRQFG